MSPTETPHGTWELRLNGNKSYVDGGSCNRCPNCEPDLDYIALLKKEIVDLRKSKVHYATEVQVSFLPFFHFLLCCVSNPIPKRKSFLFNYNR